MQQTFICEPKRVREWIHQRDTSRGDRGHWQRHEGRQQDLAERCAAADQACEQRRPHGAVTSRKTPPTLNQHADSRSDLRVGAPRV
jgi:hypothetical protein